MRAIQIEQFGDPAQVLRVVDIEDIATSPAADMRAGRANSADPAMTAFLPVTSDSPSPPIGSGGASAEPL